MLTLLQTLSFQPAELKFGTSGLRGLVSDMTDLECYINTTGFLEYLSGGGLKAGERVAVAGDLRPSTARITKSVIKAITDAGFAVDYQGLVPTPALAYWAMINSLPCIMISGSHIPDDRNGIKFYKPDGEVLKADEEPIKQAVAAVRRKIYESDAASSFFGSDGSLNQAPDLPAAAAEARKAYLQRYLDAFEPACLQGKKIVVYQHSAVGRDMLAEILQSLGAEVVTAGRSDKFIPIDSDNITPADQDYFRGLAKGNADAFAVVSCDGDGDRPLVADEKGEFHFGDVLGLVTAEWARADYCVIVAIASDALDRELAKRGVPFVRTKVGSPYVIEAMRLAVAKGARRVAGWELNGGFLLGSNLQTARGDLIALPTRDSFLPILACLSAAVAQGRKVSELFGEFPKRFTAAGLIDNFPTEVSAAIIRRFGGNTPENRDELAKYFNSGLGFGAVTDLDCIDGLRIRFANGDIAHLRPSGNAPQFRIYSVADSKTRADQIVSLALAEPGGIMRRIEAGMAIHSQKSVLPLDAPEGLGLL